MTAAAALQELAALAVEHPYGGYRAAELVDAVLGGIDELTFDETARDAIRRAARAE